MRTPAHPRAALAALVTALLAAGATAAGAGAATIASSLRGFEGGPALAPDGSVVVGEHQGDGAMRILAIDPRTRASRVLTAFPGPPDPKAYSELGVSGSGGIVTASLGTFGKDTFPVASASRTMTILPGFAVLASCGRVHGALPPIGAAGGDGFVATVRDDCGAGPTAVTIRTASGAVTIPAATLATDGKIAPVIHALRATGPMVAWIETHYPANPLPPPATGDLLVVAHAPSATVLMRAPIPGFIGAYGLGADGTVAAIDLYGGCGLRIGMPPSPVLRSLTLPSGQCPRDFFAGGGGQSTVGVAGGRVVYPATSRPDPPANVGIGADHYAVTDLAGNVHSLGGVAAKPVGGSPVAFDGRTVHVVRVDCDADRLLAVDAGVTGPPVNPPRLGAELCPVRRSGSSRLRVFSDDRVSIRLRCKRGCRGTLRLVQQRRGRRERPVGRADYLGTGGTIVVRPRIARYARALGGCEGGMRVSAIVHPIADDTQSSTPDRGRGLGAYRVVSNARCARGGGPAFTAPRPGPRP